MLIQSAMTVCRITLGLALCLGLSACGGDEAAPLAPTAQRQAIEPVRVTPGADPTAQPAHAAHMDQPTGHEIARSVAVAADQVPQPTVTWSPETVAHGPDTGASLGTQDTKSLGQTHSKLINNIATAFFVGAHPDDVPLFIARNAAADVANVNAKVVFIVMTAGDAGEGLNNGGAYYLARQRGHENAVNFWRTVKRVPGTAVAVTSVTLNGHIIERRQFDDQLVIYNMKLPDGNGSGSGYANTGYQSLTRLMNGQIATISTIDGSNTYSLANLRATLAELVRYEAGAAPSIWINTSEDSASLNAGDHADHIAASQLMSQSLSAPRYACVKHARFTTYGNSSRSANMSSGELLVQAGAWGALNIALSQGFLTNTWESGHNGWLGRQYLTRTFGGTAACTW